jgi:hypothetical protein
MDTDNSSSLASSEDGVVADRNVFVAEKIIRKRRSKTVRFYLDIHEHIHVSVLQHGTNVSPQVLLKTLYDRVYE